MRKETNCVAHGYINEITGNNLIEYHIPANFRGKRANFIHEKLFNFKYLEFVKVEGELSQAIKRIRSGSLAEANRLKKYIMVRKGKALLVRALRHLEEENMKV